MEKEKIFCKLCNHQTNLTIDSFSRYHLKPNHTMNLKEYYDKCMRKEDEGKCLHCGKETKFRGYYRGYAKFCCMSHEQKSEYTRNKISESFKNRDINKENEKRRKTCLKKYGKEYVAQVDEFQDKWKNTNLEKYGTEHTLGLDKCKKRRNKSLQENEQQINEKRKTFWRNLNEDELSIINNKKKETFKQKYGVEWNSQLESIKEKIRKSNEENGKWLKGKVKTEFAKYRSLVRNETNKHSSRVYRLWDGYDYYTGEKLVRNSEYELTDQRHFNTNLMQPSIDHKISVRYGFDNKINPKEIGSFKNLCICSRKINSTKGNLTEKQFMEKLNENQNEVNK